MRNAVGVFLSLLRVFKLQRVPSLAILGVMMLFLALVFAFVNFSPVLSPFVYPLF